MKSEQWEVSDALKTELENHYKTQYSLSLKDIEPIEIARALTFDGIAPAMTRADMEVFIEHLNTRFVKGGIRGVGLEVGSGPGTFVAAFARQTAVTRMYGAEACAAIVEILMTRVVHALAGTASEKVVGAIADFDRLALPTASVDFVFDFFSLHHSPDPAVTLTELYRVLKPGGVLICVDKARANRLSTADLEALLDTEYSNAGKRQMGVPEHVRHTRRMNGEHEYRLADWERYFAHAGFSRYEHYNCAKIGGRLPVRVLKHMLAKLPVSIQIKLSGFISPSVTNNLEPSHRIFTDIFPHYPREFSLMIVHKK